MCAGQVAWQEGKQQHLRIHPIGERLSSAVVTSLPAGNTSLSHTTGAQLPVRHADILHSPGHNMRPMPRSWSSYRRKPRRQHQVGVRCRQHVASNNNAACSDTHTARNRPSLRALHHLAGDEHSTPWGLNASPIAQQLTIHDACCTVQANGTRCTRGTAP